MGSSPKTVTFLSFGSFLTTVGIVVEGYMRVQRRTKLEIQLQISSAIFYIEVVGSTAGTSVPHHGHLSQAPEDEAFLRHVEVVAKVKHLA